MVQWCFFSLHAVGQVSTGSNVEQFFVARKVLDVLGKTTYRFIFGHTEIDAPGVPHKLNVKNETILFSEKIDMKIYIYISLRIHTPSPE